MNVSLLVSPFVLHISNEAIGWAIVAAVIACFAEGLRQRWS